MSVTVAIRFPLGRYHATGWDRSVNEGAVEWPPSPWRLLRALVSTWYTRWPDLPAETLDGLLAALAVPPSYQVPPTSPGHTRHYLPAAGHMKGQPGGTELTLDPYLWVSRSAELLVRWEVELTGEQRAALAKLVELVPYLGRAEAVCRARLLDTGPDVEQDWWRPGGDGAQTIRLLAPAGPVRRALLELGTVELRRQRRTVPPETRWVTYTRGAPTPPQPAPATPASREVTAIRFAVVTRARLRAGSGILLADTVHGIAAAALGDARTEVIGPGGAATDHQHAHWLPLAGGPGSGEEVDSLVMWVPGGLTQAEVGAIVAARRLRGISGRRGGYELKGLPRLDLLLQAAGTVEQVAPELCGPARVWRSLTPYLPVRHYKRSRGTMAEHLSADVARELGYRNLPDAVTVSAAGELPDGWALGYRRYRIKESLARARHGYGLRLRFDSEVRGPLLLGQLSHFGYGVFLPEPSH